MTRLFRLVSLERRLIVGALATLADLLWLAGSVNQWRPEHFGNLDSSRTMRWVISDVTLTTLGFQTVLSILSLSIFGIHRP